MATPAVRGQITAAGNLEYVKPTDVGTKYGGVPAIAGATTKAGGTLAVPITARICTLTTGGAEALTLANGVPGQKLTLVFVTDGGDGTLTPTTKTGFATIVFRNVKDTVTLEYIDDTVGWIITGTAGDGTNTVQLT